VSRRLYYDRDGQPMRLYDWAQRFEDMDYKRVAFDQVDDIDVSTVWLGLDHNFSGDGALLIFETIVFGGPPDVDNETQRYATEEEARAGHAELLERVRSAAALHGRQQP
jgi:hypothetical protein